MTTRVVVFDFDGVFVLDSDAVFKREAWTRIFSDHRERYRPLLERALGRYGSGKKGGRREIIQEVFEELGEPPEGLTELVERAARNFDDYVQGEITRAGLVPGAIEILEELRTRGLPLYLNSGTADEALQTSADRLGIQSYFSGVLGSGRSKPDNLRLILEWEASSPAELLMVGDSASDFTAAVEIGTRFLGVANPHNRWLSEAPGWPIVGDLRDLVRFL